MHFCHTRTHTPWFITVQWLVYVGPSIDMFLHWIHAVRFCFASYKCWAWTIVLSQMWGLWKKTQHWPQLVESFRLSALRGQGGRLELWDVNFLEFWSTFVQFASVDGQMSEGWQSVNWTLNMVNETKLNPDGEHGPQQMAELSPWIKNSYFIFTVYSRGCSFITLTTPPRKR